MSDLWATAGLDVEAENLNRTLTAARVAAAHLWPFFAAASSPEEYTDRKALAADRVEAVATAIAGGDPALFGAVHVALLEGFDADFVVLHADRVATRQEEARKTAAAKQAEAALRARIEAETVRRVLAAEAEKTAGGLENLGDEKAPPFTEDGEPNEDEDDKKESRRTAATEGPYKVQVTGIGEHVWSQNALRFQTEEEAKAYANDLMGRWMGADMARVVSSDVPNRAPVQADDPSIVVNYRTATRKTAGIYCKDHDVWVGDGNADTHEGCSKEQKATEKTKDASRRKTAIKAKILYPDGTSEIKEIAGDLDSLQALVGGMIESAPTKDGTSLYINEEGKIHGLPENPAATALCSLFPGDYIAGTAVLLGPVDDEGNETSYVASKTKDASRHQAGRVKCKSCSHTFTDSSKLGAERCPKCKSSDLTTSARRTASDGATSYCQKCGHSMVCDSGDHSEEGATHKCDNCGASQQCSMKGQLRNDARRLPRTAYRIVRVAGENPFPPKKDAAPDPTAAPDPAADEDAGAWACPNCQGTDAYTQGGKDLEEALSASEPIKCGSCQQVDTGQADPAAAPAAPQPGAAPVPPKQPVARRQARSRLPFGRTSRRTAGEVFSCFLDMDCDFTGTAAEMEQHYSAEHLDSANRDLMRQAGLDRFWENIERQLAELRSAKTAEDVMRTCPTIPGTSSGNGFFEGSGGDGTVYEALREAGWKSIWYEADYYWAMRAPGGDIITYIEGDLYKGDKGNKTSSRLTAADMTCPDCNGAGFVPSGGWEPAEDVDNGYVACPTCNGSGLVPPYDDTHPDSWQTYEGRRTATSDAIKQKVKDFLLGEYLAPGYPGNAEMVQCILDNADLSFLEAQGDRYNGMNFGDGENDLDGLEFAITALVEAGHGDKHNPGCLYHKTARRTAAESIYCGACQGRGVRNAGGAWVNCTKCKGTGINRKPRKQIDKDLGADFLGDHVGGRTAGNPYMPSSNPYVTDPPVQPGMPDEAMDGPSVGNPSPDMSGLPTTTRPRQQPSGAPTDYSTPAAAPAPAEPAPAEKQTQAGFGSRSTRIATTTHDLGLSNAEIDMILDALQYAGENTGKSNYGGLADRLLRSADSRQAQSLSHGDVDMVLDVLQDYAEVAGESDYSALADKVLAQSDQQHRGKS